MELNTISKNNHGRAGQIRYIRYLLRHHVISVSLLFSFSHNAASHCTSEDGPEESLRAKVKTVLFFFLRSTEGICFFRNQVLTRFTLQLRHFISLLTNFETGRGSVRLSQSAAKLLQKTPPSQELEL